MNEAKEIICEPQRESVLHEIMGRLEHLSEFAEKTSCRVSEKLNGVCNQEQPSPEECTSQVEREYPPIFNEMRQRLDTIDYSLKSLNRTMDRCEV